MNILHYYDKSDSITTQYMAMLGRMSFHETTMFFASDYQEAVKILQLTDIDILHIHGCWRTSAARLYAQVCKQATRLVVSPHGQLEPWFFRQRFWKEKLPKRILFQRRMVSSAYAVVVEGSMEAECLHRLGWNSRIVVIRNPLVTSFITPEENIRQLAALYRRVMDSNPIELMRPETISTLRLAIKAGIVLDIRWLRLPDHYTPPRLGKEAWRQIHCFARQEQIEPIVERGIRLLQCDYPLFDTRQSSPFLPDGYKPSEGIDETIGKSFASENQRLVETFRLLHNLSTHNRLSICHLCELDKELREHDCEEEELAEHLKVDHLLKTARRLMQVMQEETGFDEGFMPVTPLNDRTTRKLKRQLKNHLKI